MCGVGVCVCTYQCCLYTSIIFSTLDRLDRFVIIMVMNPFENYKFYYSVDFVRTLTLGMLTTAIHIELIIISFSRRKVLSLDDTFKSE